MSADRMQGRKSYTPTMRKMQHLPSLWLESAAQPPRGLRPRTLLSGKGTAQAACMSDSTP